MAGEVVTLQLGHYAGCVGAHWWGLQRCPPEGTELSHAALLRAGRDGCTPRLIALELKGGVGPLGRGGARPEPLAAWRGDVANYAEPGTGTALRDRGQRPGDASADADCGSGAPGEGAAPSAGSSTQLWSDYLSVQLHPRSIYVLQQYNHDGYGRAETHSLLLLDLLLRSSLHLHVNIKRSRRRAYYPPLLFGRDSGRLEAFGQGEKLLQDASCMEELEDRLHFYAEECDYLQGFQVLCDLHDGFSGVGAKVTEVLQDEYSRKGILTWGLTPVTHTVADSQKNFYRALNAALGIVHLSAHSSLFCPLSLSGSLGIKPQPPIEFPYVNYDASLNYHSSAVLAAALDTLTVPYRLCSSRGSMMHLAEMLSFSGRKVVAAWAAVPFPAVRGHSLPDALCAHQQDVPWKLLSSCKEQKVSRCFAQSVVLRGVCKESPTSCPGQQPPSPLHACETAEQVLQYYLHTAFPGAFSASHVLEQPCVTLPPYPRIFSPLLSRQGFLPDDLSSYSAAAVESIPVLTSLQSSPVLRTLLCDLCKDLQKLGTRRCASFFAAGVEEDDFHEALQELRTLSQCYQMGFEADNSEDESDSD